MSQSKLQSLPEENQYRPVNGLNSGLIGAKDKDTISGSSSNGFEGGNAPNPSIASLFISNKARHTSLSKTKRPETSYQIRLSFLSTPAPVFASRMTLKTISVSSLIRPEAQINALMPKDSIKSESSRRRAEAYWGQSAFFATSKSSLNRSEACLKHSS